MVEDGDVLRVYSLPRAKLHKADASALQEEEWMEEYWDGKENRGIESIPTDGWKTDREERDLI